MVSFAEIGSAASASLREKKSVTYPQPRAVSAIPETRSGRQFILIAHRFFLARWIRGQV
jgi:hypothetical protein